VYRSDNEQFGAARPAAPRSSIAPVSNVEELLRAYVESSTIEEAERSVDRLADEEMAPPQVSAFRRPRM
jgi:hypothetical protein